jgi:hypothetical protein
MKGQTRNIETFKVGAGTRMNEFDFHKHQEEMHEHHEEEVHTIALPETKAERMAEVMKKAHEKVLKRKKGR